LFHDAGPDPFGHLIPLLGHHGVAILAQENTENVPSGEDEILPRQKLI
jgi:hypothetical protein